MQPLKTSPSHRRNWIITQWLLAALVLAPPIDAQDGEDEWLSLIARSVAVVTATVAEPQLAIEHPERRVPRMEALADGRVKVHMPPLQAYQAGSLTRFRIDAIAKSDGRTAAGGTIEVFADAWLPELVTGRRFLLFLTSPIQPQGSTDVVNGWQSLYGTVLTRPDLPAEVPFEPGRAYGITAVSAHGQAFSLLPITPEIERFVGPLMEFVAATTRPWVEIASPSDGSVLAEATALIAFAADDVAVTEVQFQVDGVDFGEPVPASLFVAQSVLDPSSLESGAHTITALARDAVGNQTESAAVVVTVPSATQQQVPGDPRGR